MTVVKSCVLPSLFLLAVSASNGAWSGEFLPAQELTANKAAAIHGDARSAMRLANHYLYFENDIQESNFWTRLAAELGDCRAVNEILDRAKHGVFPVGKGTVSFWEERGRSECGGTRVGP